MSDQAYNSGFFNGSNVNTTISDQLGLSLTNNDMGLEEASGTYYSLVSVTKGIATWDMVL